MQRPKVPRATRKATEVSTRTVIPAIWKYRRCLFWHSMFLPFAIPDDRTDRQLFERELHA